MWILHWIMHPIEFFLIFSPFFLKILKIYLFLERGEGREKEGEKHRYVVASRTPPTGDLVCNPGMCPDWESNQQPFGLQVISQSTEPHQPGQEFFSKKDIMGTIGKI